MQTVLHVAKNDMGEEDGCRRDGSTGMDHFCVRARAWDRAGEGVLEQGDLQETEGQLTLMAGVECSRGHTVSQGVGA